MMGNAFIQLGCAMFGIPMFVMLIIAGIGMEIPPFILHNGGWSMALGIIVAGIGAAMILVED